VSFIQAIARRTHVVPGSVLVRHFDQCAKRVSGLGGSDLSFDAAILEVNLVPDEFMEARAEVLPLIQTYVRTPINTMSLDQLKQFDQQPFTNRAANAMLDQFRAKCEQNYQRSVATCRQLYAEFEKGIRQEVQKTVRDVYFDQVFAKVLPSEIDLKVILSHRTLFNYIDHPSGLRVHH
jgi:hypothetical protein